MYEGVESEAVQPAWDDIRSLLVARNRFALATRGSSTVSHWRNSSSSDALTPAQGALRYESALALPQLLKMPGECTRCYQAAECMLYHVASENGSAQTSGVPDLFQAVIGTLKPVHLAYFKHWDRLIDLESSIGSSSRFELWTLEGKEREKSSGQCSQSL